MLKHSCRVFGTLYTYLLIPYSVQVHNKSHEGEKCWKCDLCPYASVSQRHLESHMLIHTDEKPYQCEQCDQVNKLTYLI